MRARLFVVVAGVVALLVASATGPVWAHHSFWVEFDSNKPVTVQGTVARMEWINPHAWLHIDVTRPDGTIEQWMIEGGVPSLLFRRGFTMKSLLPGMVVTVEGYRSRTMARRANGGDITFPDGQTLFFSFSQPTRREQLEIRDNRGERESGG